MKKIIFIKIFVIIFLFHSCSDLSPSETLYQRLGGLDTISIITDKFLVNIESDTIINSYFTPVMNDSIRKLNLRNHLIDQFCEVTGGPCIYKGKTMKLAHQGMMISNMEYDAILQDLSNSLDSVTIIDPEKNDFLTIIENYRDEIINQ